MSKIETPLFDPIVDEQGYVSAITWTLFFQQLTAGDNGTTFTPIATNLGSVGTPTINGVYYQNQGFTDFYITVTPATNTTSTVGSTYFSLPFDVTIDGGCFATTTGSSGVGMVDAANNRVYTPNWSAITVPVTISGRVKTV